MTSYTKTMFRKNDICPQVSKAKYDDIQKKYPHLPIIEDFTAIRKEAFYRLP